MKLLYFKGDAPNFGDDLNLALWPRLAPALFAEEEDGDGFLGIGTVIGMRLDGLRRVHVFSSGAGYAPIDRTARPYRFHCVRGPLTARLLGLERDRAVTDGALLTPLAEGFPRHVAPCGRVAVVPHYESGPRWREACQLAGFSYIDPSRPPAEVIADIAGAGLVLTESLHGAIIADSYGIEWIPFATSRNFSVFKWVDWTMSVGVDLAVATVPPPDPQPLLRFGRPLAGEWGGVIRHDADDASREMNGRLAQAAAVAAAGPRSSPGLRAIAKTMLRHLPLARRLLGFTPQRTADGLHRLLRHQRFLSEETRRDSLRACLLERLDRLIAEAARSS